MRTHYICKYTPTELLAAYGGECAALNHMPEDFSAAEQYTHPNLCGFGKALLQSVLSGEVRELVLVACCDTIRRICDVLADSGKPDFLYLLDLPHDANACGRETLAAQLRELAEAYGAYKGTSFDEAKFRAAFHAPAVPEGSYFGIFGARCGDQLAELAQNLMTLPVKNCTCVNNRPIGTAAPPEGLSFEALMDWYAGELLAQTPCMRMIDPIGRRSLYEDPKLAGVIYHTVKFCDFYGFEYAQLREKLSVPLLKIESDYTVSAAGQLRTRLEAFAEAFDRSGQRTKTNAQQTLSDCNPFANQGRASAGPPSAASTRQGRTSIRPSSADQIASQTPQRVIPGNEASIHMEEKFYAGIDSGSSSTDVVILDRQRQIVSAIVLPTGAGASNSAQQALQRALEKAGLAPEALAASVATGYGRAAIQHGGRSITEITCHARGAHHLNPAVRTVIDIGGQDSKVIRLDPDGGVANFVMNDKCAAGTGRFLEMMARTLQMELSALGERGLRWQEDITISSMCTVFAESEVVSLIAENKAVDDIVHGLDKAVASKTVSLIRRVGGEGPYMMTGGVARNQGVVAALNAALGETVAVDDCAQLCGALGAALFASEA